MLEKWMTYSDAADRLGIKLASVKRQARAKNWARRTMNDGVVQVAIPADRLAERPTDSPPAHSAPDHTAELSARLSAAEVRAGMAEKRASEIAEDRDHWRGMAERLSERRSIFDRIFNR
jgi:hypothetical protein